MKRVRPFVLALVGPGLTVAALFAAPPATTLRFEKLNRTYSDFMPELAGLEENGITVRLSSPKQTMILRDHSIRLTPRPDGSFDAVLDLQIQGKGTLIADLTLGPAVQQIPDEVVVPPQTISLAGRAMIRRVEGGYEVTATELPAQVEVAVQSQAANQILALCDNAALLTLGAIDCGGLESTLTRPAMPLPAGQSFVLSDGDLSPANRLQLDALISGR